MGKYSLDAFEQYPLVKLRPKMTALASQCCCLLEPDAESLPETGGEQLLRLRLEKREAAEVCREIRQLAVRWAGGKGLAGVVMEAGEISGEALDVFARACREGFAETVLLVQPGTELAEACRREGIAAGLWLPLDEGILPLRRAIGEENLARNWERFPVYVYAARGLTGEELDAARRWHASGANVPAPLGAQMTLRRMMFPKDLTSGGLLPLRMWWQNIGTAPLYQEVHVRLELRQENQRFSLSLGEPMKTPGLGDSTYNTIARLPAAPNGTYTLWCGLESGGRMLPLAMDAPATEGSYKIGELTLDDVPRPYLQTLWETQYADGYYPLEDPAQPE